MRRAVLPLCALSCAAGLFVFLFEGVLFRGEQFGFRDAAHYYYPLYQEVQGQWESGRVPPLWSVSENAGMPLLGNPTAAVLYPGKLIYAALPYPWAARVYPMAHVLLAAAAAFLLLRDWGVSRTGSGLGALAYAFSGPVLFQYCNIIYLVGASWLPLGLMGADRWLRRGRRGGLVLLAVALVCQTLGGDPETAYLLGLCAAGYAVALSIPPTWRRPGPPAVAALVIAAGIVWVAATLAVEIALAPDPPLPASRVPAGPPAPRLWWLPVGRWRQIMLGAWSAAALALVVQVVRTGRRVLAGRLLGLIVAAVLAALVMGMQLLPIVEFTRMSVRAAEDGSHGYFAFSVEPYRLVEWIWAGPFGTPMVGNRSWLMALPPKHSLKFWVPSLYAGGLTIVLALGAGAGAGRIRRAPRAWLAAIALVSLLAAMGEFASPLWIARNLPGMTERLGPHDPTDMGEHRRDGHLPDGVGSPYWLMAQVFPAFDGFRYPSKLLTFTSLALAALAGGGWDAVAAGRGRGRAAAWLAALLGLLSAALAVAAVAGRAEMLRFWDRQVKRMDVFTSNSFGPFDPLGAHRETVVALGQGAAVLLAAAVVVALAWRRPRAWGLAAIALLAVDLAIANRATIMTVPQSLFETEPEALRVIREAERADPAPGPYRVHRMPLWEPTAWLNNRSADRVRELVQWERTTLQPKYGIPHGIEYTVTEGVGELYDYWFFFAPFYGTNDDMTARAVGLPPGTKLVYFPRRGFDLWGSRYYILPRLPANDERRGYYAFLPQTRRLFPPEGRFTGPDAPQRTLRWDIDNDWQVLRNENAYPRAWVVHSARVVRPIRDMTRESREGPMEEVLYQADELWYNPDRTLWDPRRMAWIETDDAAALQPFRTGGPTGPAETVTVTRHEPDHVELDAVLDRPGFVVLADVFYPGWTLTIDGRPAPILRANRAMRGAAVAEGRHHLVYRYQPRSVRMGAALSLSGLLGLGLAFWWSRRPPLPWGRGAG